MTRTLTTIFVALLAALLFAGTAYADSDTDSSAANASLQFGATSSNSVYLMIGNAATVDTLSWSNLGVPSYSKIQDDASTDVAIEVDVTMVDASEDCVLTVVGSDLASGGNIILISEFQLTASGEFTFSADPLSTISTHLETLTTSGQYTGTFIVEYNNSFHVPPGTYTPTAAYAAVFTATIQ